MNKLYFDWISIILYSSLVTFGLVNIYSTDFANLAENKEILSTVFGKQCLFVIISVIIGVLIITIKPKIFESVSGIFYLLSIISLIGLFIFGKKISGSTSWYSFGSFNFQPSEFAKITVALFIAKKSTGLQFNLSSLDSILSCLGIILFPIILIVLQPDPGSALVFCSFIFVLYREGLSGRFILFPLLLIVLFIILLLFPLYSVIIGVFIILFSIYFISTKINKKTLLRSYIFYFIIVVGFSFSVDYIFHNVFEQRHRDRINIVLNKTQDLKGIGYNVNQSKIAIGSGKLTGKGFTQGTQTQGGFVPRQHTDYIFSTIGEEWGFLGTSLVILAFCALILRILYKAEKQKNSFSRIYAYSTASILLLHFIINIGMTIGIFPTVGIPLPFISYGGSGLLSFTILLMIYISFDANRLNNI